MCLPSYETGWHEEMKVHADIEHIYSYFYTYTHAHISLNVCLIVCSQPQQDEDDNECVGEEAERFQLHRMKQWKTKCAQQRLQQEFRVFSLSMDSWCGVWMMYRKKN